MVAGVVEHEEPLQRTAYHDGDGENITESEVRKLKEPDEVQELHWTAEEESRTKAQLYANKRKQLSNTKQMNTDDYTD